jgi:predicted DsbA family dithiol-disulfide isomerase
MNQGKWGINSRPALIGMKYAETQGKGAAYHKAVFEAYFLDAKNIEEEAVLGEIAESVGLDRTPFLDSLTDAEFISAVMRDVTTAHQYQIRGVPALIFENKYYIPGAQPYEELVRVVEQLEKRLAEAK